MAKREPSRKLVPHSIARLLKSSLRTPSWCCNRYGRSAWEYCSSNVNHQGHTIDSGLCVVSVSWVMVLSQCTICGIIVQCKQGSQHTGTILSYLHVWCCSLMHCSATPAYELYRISCWAMFLGNLDHEER